MVNEWEFKRHRRLRSSAAMRSLVRENHLKMDDFIYPLFIIEGENIKNEVPSMPGVYQISLDHVKAEMEELLSLGIKAVMLFGVRSEERRVGKESRCQW